MLSQKTFPTLAALPGTSPYELLESELSDDRDVEGVSTLGGGAKRLELTLPGKGLEKWVDWLYVDLPVPFDDGDPVLLDEKSKAGGRLKPAWRGGKLALVEELEVEGVFVFVEVHDDVSRLARRQDWEQQKVVKEQQTWQTYECFAHASGTRLECTHSWLLAGPPPSSQRMIMRPAMVCRASHPLCTRRFWDMPACPLRPCRLLALLSGLKRLSHPLQYAPDQGHAGVAFMRE
ncbi:MAG: hypothetical protein Q9188_000535 [Gyalolechia gomerana]